MTVRTSDGAGPLLGGMEGAERAPREPERTPRYDLVVMAASAGGLAALQAVLRALPADFPAAIAIVQHRGADRQSVLPAILARHAKLTVKLAEPGEPLRPGTAYVAPADLHLIVGADRRLHVFDGSKVKWVRSSANPLFTSAAAVFGARTIAIVLTGGGSDATDGVQSVKAGGGIVIAQDERTSAHFSMPRAAIASGAVDHVLPLDRIAPALVSLVTSGRLPEG